jgi:large subunit ribosomal protein L21
MFAVIKTGGKQYKVAAADKIAVMALEGEAGAQVTFSEVLALFDGERSEIGAPQVAGASVVGEIVEQTRGPKVFAFKKRRRKNSRRKRGHRQDLTIVKITQILAGGAEPATEPATEKPATAFKDEAPARETAAETAEAATAKPAAKLKAKAPAAKAATTKPAAAAKAEAPARAAGTEAAALDASKAKKPKKAPRPKTGGDDEHEG